MLVAAVAVALAAVAVVAVAVVASPSLLTPTCASAFFGVLPLWSMLALSFAPPSFRAFFSPPLSFESLFSGDDFEYDAPSITENALK